VYSEVVEWLRTIRSPDPRRFELTDAVKLASVGTVSLHFHSRYPWNSANGAWSIEAKRCRLTIVPAFEAATHTANEDFVDGMGEPVYHLAIGTERALKHNLRAIIHVDPI
jgi:hypothetical protein